MKSREEIKAEVERRIAKGKADAQDLRNRHFPKLANNILLRMTEWQEFLAWMEAEA